MGFIPFSEPSFIKKKPTTAKKVVRIHLKNISHEVVFTDA